MMPSWNRLERWHPVELLRARPILSARLRLFALLAVVGPVFAGLHYLVLDAAPPAQTQVIVSDTAASVPDVVVVERVVERPVYVPIDQLPSGAVGPSATQIASQPEVSGVRTAEPAALPGRDLAAAAPAEEASPDEAAAQQADATEPESEAVVSASAANARRVAPPAWVPPPSMRVPVAPIDEEPEAAEEEQPVEEVAEAAPEEAVAAPEADGSAVNASEVVVVHTLMWDGEQYVETVEGGGEQVIPVGERDPIDVAPEDIVAEEPEAQPEAAAPQGEAAAETVAEATEAVEEATVADANAVVAAGDPQDGESVPEDAVAEGEGEATPESEAAAVAGNEEAAAPEEAVAVEEDQATDEAAAADVPVADGDEVADAPQPEAEAVESSTIAPQGTRTAGRQTGAPSSEIILPVD